MGWKLCESQTPPYFIFTGGINQSDHDKRQLRLIRLHNGMQILLVHDAGTSSTVAAVKLTVTAGHLHDPDDLPGLSHFLEHVLTQGSERHPEWTKYLLEHRGGWGAYTTAESTNYSFYVSNHGLDGALERFASFLCQPLFGQQGISRQVRNVESEFQNYRLDDMRRLDHLDAYLSKADSRWRRFGEGNWETLARTTTRDDEASLEEESKTWIDGLIGRLCAWFSEYYYASRMSMAVIGADSLDELTKMVVSRFSAVPGPKISLPAFTAFQSPWGPDQEGTLILARTIRDVRQIEVRWIVPTQTLLYRVKPLAFLQYFLHRRGSGSLQEALISRGWVTSLHASPFAGDREQGFQFFKVIIHLTSAGWYAWQTVLGMLHKYLALVKHTIIADPDFAESMQKELCSLSEVRFRFQDTSDSPGEAELLGSTLSKSVPPEDLMTGPHVTQDCNMALISRTLALLSHDKARVILGGQEWKGMTIDDRAIPENTSWDKTPWFNTEYKVFRLVQAGSPAYTPDDAAAVGLFLRKPHSFVPKNLEVVGGAKAGVEPVPHAQKIYENAHAELWHKLDDQFGVPKTSVIIKLITALNGSTARQAIFTKILHNLINRVLADDIFDAGYSLLSCEVHCAIDEILVMVYGFSTNIPMVIKNVFDKIKQVTISPDLLQDVVEKIRRHLENQTYDAPGDAADERLKCLLVDDYWTAAQLLSQLDLLAAVKPYDIQAHLTGILDSAYIRVLVNGNTKAEDAISIIRSVEDILGRSSSSVAKRPSWPRRDLLPEGCNFVHEIPVPNSEEKNSAVAFYCQVGHDASAPMRARLALWLAIVSAPIFNQLQVTEQLGYEVGVSQLDQEGTLGFRVLIQGTGDPCHFEERIEVCLGAMRQHLDELGETGFENAKQRYIRRVQIRPKDIEKEAYRFWDHITHDDCDFTRREMVVRSAESLTTADMFAFLERYIIPGSPTRRKLSVRFKSVQHNRSVEDTAESATMTEDAACFKASLLSSESSSNVTKK